MSRRRTLLATVSLAAIAIAWAAGASATGTLSASASCTGGNAISLVWTFYEDPSHPTGHPEWVGYDILRRSMSDCGGFTRVNAVPYPRTPGVTESFTYTETPPAVATTFEYQVVLVDANRQPVYLDPATCDCVAHNGWASCPAFSAPLTQGTLQDLGWALFVEPSPGTCYSGFYFSDQHVIELRPYAGTGTVLRFYGSAGCGSVEGCSIAIDHYEVVSGPTPGRHVTWGRVKTIYR